MVYFWKSENNIPSVIKTLVCHYIILLYWFYIQYNFYLPENYQNNPHISFSKKKKKKTLCRFKQPTRQALFILQHMKLLSKCLFTCFLYNSLQVHFVFAFVLGGYQWVVCFLLIIMLYKESGKSSIWSWNLPSNIQ